MTAPLEDFSEHVVPDDHFIAPPRFIGKWLDVIGFIVLAYALAGVMLVLAWLTVQLALAMLAPAFAHDAVPTASKPLGWSYPFACCSGYDCRAVPETAIGEGAAGYTILGTGEVLAYGDTRLKESPDGMFHWCSVAGADDGRTICLFVPPRSY